jgi:uncharacterized protein YrrD
MKIIPPWLPVKSNQLHFYGFSVVSGSHPHSLNAVPDPAYNFSGTLMPLAIQKNKNLGLR